VRKTGCDLGVQQYPFGCTSPTAIFVTDGAGFIGNKFVQDWFARHDEPVVNLDEFTYARNMQNLSGLPNGA
jgi:dTDP-D-glucose 4,6-dehydratase